MGKAVASGMVGSVVELAESRVGGVGVWLLEGLLESGCGVGLGLAVLGFLLGFLQVGCGC